MIRIDLDVLVFGAGIAGLWAGALLRARGDACAIIESGAVGGVQTMGSQGIIHGGIKYALTGSASRASRAIARMPEVWRDCLAGSGPIDLTDVRVLSESQTLFTGGGIGARLAGVAASQAIRTRVDRIPVDERPSPFDSAPRGVDVYRVGEPVLDPAGVVAALHRQAPPVLRSDLSSALEMHDDGVSVTLGSVVLTARRVVLCAGAGNGPLLDRLAPGVACPAMQIRPLHMVFARGVELPMMYAHAVGVGARPVATVTSQRDAHGRTVWYIGGDIAERGVERSREAQIDATRAELTRLLPWIDLSEAEWATLRIDRAEPATATGHRPDEPFVESVGPAIVVWPTKLAFAPAVGERVVELIEPGRAGAVPNEALTDVERAPMAALPWDREDLQWS